MNRYENRYEIVPREAAVRAPEYKYVVFRNGHFRSSESTEQQAREVMNRLKRDDAILRRADKAALRRASKGEVRPR
jgi:hypothetical protein